MNRSQRECVIVLSALLLLIILWLRSSPVKLDNETCFHLNQDQVIWLLLDVLLYLRMRVTHTTTFMDVFRVLFPVYTLRVPSWLVLKAATLPNLCWSWTALCKDGPKPDLW